jgi:dihydroorotate dehydrogenase
MEELLRQPPPLDPPLMNAAGSLGFAPNLRIPSLWSEFGAFVTNPVSMQPRKPASGKRWQAFSGGVLFHSGYPNPGFWKVLEQFGPRWAQAPLPVIVHLLASQPEELQRCVLELETAENILAIEIGFPEAIGKQEAVQVISAALGELPLIARLPLTRSVDLAPALIEAGVVAVSLAPPRGTLPMGDDVISGRLYGPALYPLALQVVGELNQAGVAVIGAGGIYHRQQVEGMHRAGAWAVQVDLALWRGDWLDLEEG